jgi:putative endopeptidase
MLYTKMLNAAGIIAFAAVCTLQACKERPGSDVYNGNKPDLLASHLDTTVKPGDDFFTYANGFWFKNNPIPNSESGWGIFSLVDQENKERIKKISQEASATSGKKGSSAQLIGDFFSSGMDSIGIEKRGAAAIGPQMAIVDNIATPKDVIVAMGKLANYGVACVFDLSIYADLKNSDKNMVYLSQGGLGMADKSYYFDNDAQTKSVRAAYPGYIAKLLQLSGADSATAAARAQQVLSLETKMAAIHKPIEEVREAEKNYYKMSKADFQKTTIGMDWTTYFTELGIKEDSVIACQPKYLAAVGPLLAGTPIDVWKAYLRFHLVRNMAPYLSDGFVKADFAFNGDLQGGAKEIKDRWKRVLDAQEDALGDALGQLYVKEYFSENAKKRYLKITNAVVDAYREHILTLDWMGDSTKQKAVAKLSSITKKVGYPDKWKTYAGMEIVRDNYAQNVLNANKWSVAFEIAKLGKPVDRTEWGMTPQTYNAYYNPSNNEIVLPAAMFTAPGYADEELDDALVYGYVGASTIGHELTHGFDDQGRKFDSHGNMVDWWTKADADQFSARTAKLVDQFNKYTVLENKHPNGALTLGENIADLGGVVVGYDAFAKTEQFKRGKKLGGLTPAQRYFLGYAYGWMQVRRPEKLAQQLLTDEHAPIMLRVNGPMSNCDQWYTAFGVQKGNAMWRDSANRVRLW